MTEKSQDAAGWRAGLKRSRAIVTSLLSVYLGHLPSLPPSFPVDVSTFPLSSKNNTAADTTENTTTDTTSIPVTEHRYLMYIDAT